MMLFGFGGGEENKYGDSYLLIAELHLLYEDGTTEIIFTDENWSCRSSSTLASGIYFGESRDDTLIQKEGSDLIIAHNTKYEGLSDRLSPPIKVMETRKPENIYLNHQQELIVDMGQNMVGWLSFINNLDY